MNHGKVEKHDTVTNVFKDSEYLNSLGIDLPIITNFIININPEIIMNNYKNKNAMKIRVLREY